MLEIAKKKNLIYSFRGDNAFNEALEAFMDLWTGPETAIMTFFITI